jgi:hypothetical protein
MKNYVRFVKYIYVVETIYKKLSLSRESYGLYTIYLTMIYLYL